MILLHTNVISSTLNEEPFILLFPFKSLSILGGVLQSIWNSWCPVCYNIFLYCSLTNPSGFRGLARLNSGRHLVFWRGGLYSSWVSSAFWDPNHSCVCWSLGRVQLFTTTWTVAHQAPLSMEFSRILEWVAIPFSRQSSRLRDRTHISFIAGRVFTIRATREAHCILT